MSGLSDIVPQNLGVRYHPPAIYLTYDLHGETLFHQFPLSATQLRLPIDTLYNKISMDHPGYLEHVEPSQMCKFIKLLKENQRQPRKSSRAQQLRHQIHGAKLREGYNRQVKEIALFDDLNRKEIFP